MLIRTNEDVLGNILAFLSLRELFIVSKTSKTLLKIYFIALQEKLFVHFPHYIPKAISASSVEINNLNDKFSLKLYKTNSSHTLFKEAYSLEYVTEEPNIKLDKNIIRIFEIAKEDDISALESNTKAFTLKDFVEYEDTTKSSPLWWARKNKSQRVLDFIYNNLIQPVFEDQEINFSDDYQNTLLHWAILCNQTEIAKSLIEAGADIHLKNASGKNALMLAVKCSDEIIIDSLLTKKPEINAKDINGRTALHLSIPTKNKSLIRKLLTHEEIDLTTKDKEGVTIAYLASENNDVETLKFLENENIDIHLCKDKQSRALHAAAANNSIDAVNFYLEHKANVNVSNNLNETALYIACEKGHIKIVERLLKEPSIDINIINKETGVTSLFIATQKGHVEIIKLLLNSKKLNNINEKFKLGATVLFVAAKIGSVNIFNLLVENGADLYATLTNGKTIEEITNSADIKASMQNFQKNILKFK